MFDRRFRIAAKIAAGGFGAIYRATHLKSGHEFALKVLHPNLTSDSKVVARFLREGATLTRLRDPHTVTAYELGEAPDGTLYIVMELLRGESLYERYRVQGRLPWRRVITIARAVCSSLAEAHELGVIHRDLKPTNIHLEPRDGGEDFVKVLDFGIAKILQGSELDATDLTHVGQMIGTLDYMSPEQMVGGQCAPSSDIYTLGIVMYEMIAGKKPYEDATSAAAALAAVLTVTPDRVSTLAIVPADVDRVVMRCIERAHGDRFQSASDLAAALDEILAAGDEAVTSVAPSSKPPQLGPRSTPSSTPSPVASPVASPMASPVASIDKPAPAGPRPAPAGPTRTPGSGPVAKPTPTPEPGRINFDSTLVGHMPVTHLPATPRRLTGTPHGTPVVSAPLLPAPTGTIPPLSPAVLDEDPDDLDALTLDPPSAAKIRLLDLDTPLEDPPSNVPVGSAPFVPVKSLREAYPKLGLAPPSPTRPIPTAFDDRPKSTAGTIVPYGTARRMRRNAMIRLIALGLGAAILTLAALLLASLL
ncbi:MAG TPA: protein kinase [Kofleriaceae bacterium]|nr:protein kinase [Kofleriaceae bacterium]